MSWLLPRAPAACRCPLDKSSPCANIGSVGRVPSAIRGLPALTKVPWDSSSMYVTSQNQIRSCSTRSAGCVIVASISPSDAYFAPGLAASERTPGVRPWPASAQVLRSSGDERCLTLPIASHSARSWTCAVFRVWEAWRQRTAARARAGALRGHGSSRSSTTWTRQVRVLVRTLFHGG